MAEIMFLDIYRMSLENRLFSEGHILCHLNDVFSTSWWCILLLPAQFPCPILYINLACLSVCLSVCLFVSNKRQNGWTDQAQILCGTSRGPRKGIWMIKISKICLHQNSIFKNFKNSRNFFWKSAKFFVFVIF